MRIGRQNSMPGILTRDIWRNPGMSLMWKNSKYWRTDRRRRHYMCADGSRIPMIEQTIRFYRHTARIDFQTRVDWQEHQQLLRVSFPVDILAHEADYEIQFGNVKRPTHKNTSWDQVQDSRYAHTNGQIFPSPVMVWH